MAATLNSFLENKLIKKDDIMYRYRALFRVISIISYETQKLYLQHILLHARSAKAIYV